MKYRYVGAPCYLTGCIWLGELAAGDPCCDGQCSGMIMHDCPFTAKGPLYPVYEGMFEVIDDE